MAVAPGVGRGPLIPINIATYPKNSFVEIRLYASDPPPGKDVVNESGPWYARVVEVYRCPLNDYCIEYQLPRPQGYENHLIALKYIIIYVSSAMANINVVDMKDLSHPLTSSPISSSLEIEEIIDSSDISFLQYLPFKSVSIQAGLLSLQQGVVRITFSGILALL